MNKATQRICFAPLASRVCVWAILALAIVSVYNSAQAAATTRTWDGGGANDNINTAANWVGDVAPVNGDLLVFTGSTRTTPALSANLTVDSITFNSSASPFTLGGGSTFTITPVVASFGVENQDADNQTINTATKLGANQTWKATSGKLTIGGALDSNGKALTIDGGFDVTVSGVVSGSGSLTKIGSGSLTLSGTANNSFTGTTTVNEGTILLNKTAGQDAISGALVIGDDSGGANADVVRLSAANQLPDNTAVTINTSGLLDLNGNSDKVGTLDMTAGSVTTGAGTLTLGGTVTGNGNANSATISGNLNLGGDRTFTIANGAAAEDMSISAVISGANKLTKDGTGTLVLSGVNTYGTGKDTKLEAGTIAVGNNSALGASRLVLSGGTIQSDSTASRTLGNEVFQDAASTIGGSGAMTFTGTYTAKNAAQTLTVNNTAATTFSGTSFALSDNNTAGTVTVNVAGASGGVTISAVIENRPGGGGGAGKLIKDGAGTLTLSGANTYTGGTTLSAGTLQLGADNVIPNTGTFAFSGGTLDANNKSEPIVAGNAGIGQLSLTANSSILLHADATDATLSFASGTRSGGVLTIDQWEGSLGSAGTGDRIFFTSNTGIDATFLANVAWSNLNGTGGSATGATLLGTGPFELVPVPEPGTIFAGFLVVGIFGWSERKRLRRFLPIGVRS